MNRVERRLSALLLQYTVRVERDLDTVIREQSLELLRDIQIGWPVDSGISRAAWEGPIRVDEAHYRLINPIIYAAVIEYGGYPGVGPKTAQEGGTTLPGDVSINAGIYPTQVPSAPTRRALSKRIVTLRRAIDATVRRN